MFDALNSLFAKFTWFEPYKDVRNYLSKDDNRTILLEEQIRKATNQEIGETYELYYIRGLSNYKIADELNINVRIVNKRKRELYAFVDGLLRTL